MSETYPFYSEEEDGMSKREQLEEYFSQSLEVDTLLRLCPDDEDTIYQIVDLLVDTCATNRKMLRIAGDDKPAEVVRSRFMKLNADHIQFVLKCLAENSSPIRNMKQYLLASLYNAPTTMQLVYQNRTNHDFAHGSTSGSVDPSVDNMLKITSDGRKIGLDQRLMNFALPDDPNSKLNACVNNVLRIWNDTKEQKLTQLIFCDMSTPKGDGSFNVYDDIRTKLLNAGVPEQEIEFIHNADTENKKAELFSKVRSGQVRVLLGSTAKMGAGTNVQTLLVAVHHLDVGWRPSDMTQRNGRIILQGNQNKQVYVYNYVTESTFDAYLYVRHEVA